MTFELGSALGQYLKHVKTPDAVVNALYAALGADAETTLEDVFEIPKESVSEGVEKYKAAVADGKTDGTELTPLQVGKVYSTIKKIKALFEPTAPALLPAPASDAAPPNIQLAPVPEASKRKLSQVLDQTDESTFEKLSSSERAEMRDIHRKVTGDAPPEPERPSSDQLAALKAKLATGEAPYVDFAIWSPFGKRGAKIRKFDAQVFVDNELKTRAIPGPSNFEGRFHDMPCQPSSEASNDFPRLSG